jgi:hypothetical protein
MTRLEIVGGDLIVAPSRMAFHFKGFARPLQPEGFTEGLGNLPLFVFGRVGGRGLLMGRARGQNRIHFGMSAGYGHGRGAVVAILESMPYAPWVARTVKFGLKRGREAV